MDTTSFHTLLRSLTSHASRRHVLHGLAGALGLAGAPVLPKVADVKNKKRNKRRRRCNSCGPCRRCQKGKCKPKADGTACGSGTICQGGACLCPTACCADADCGVCRACQNGTCVTMPGAACGSGRTCLANGSCAVVCDFSGHMPCPDGCDCRMAVEGPSLCFDSGISICDQQGCTSTTECLQGQSCQLFNCPAIPDRCVPLCPA